MSKPAFPNITTSQTFQNWFDATNDVIDIIQSSAVTASVTGDSTTGDATLVGDFTANTITGFDVIKSDNFESRASGNTITIASPVNIVSTNAKIAATFNFSGSGALSRYTNGTASWDIGIDNSTDLNFVMNQGSGGQLKLSPQGVLTVPSLTVIDDINFPTDANGQFTGTLSAANANITDTLTANNATFTYAYSDNFRGKFTGDIYHPAGQKVFENGGPDASIPATFTGNVLGTVSSLTNHSTDSLKEGTTNLYFKNSRVRGALTAGTGVSIIADPNDSNKAFIAIGQSVGTTADVTFKSVTATGNITAFFGTTSDRNLKENIEPITSALDKVSKINGYTFNYKGNDERMAGVIAQEIIEVLPEAVFETTDPKTGNTVLAVRYDNIIGLLIEAIKELQDKVGN